MGKFTGQSYLCKGSGLRRKKQLYSYPLFYTKLYSNNYDALVIHINSLKF